MAYSLTSAGVACLISVSNNTIRLLLQKPYLQAKASLRIHGGPTPTFHTHMYAFEWALCRLPSTTNSLRNGNLRRDAKASIRSRRGPSWRGVNVLKHGAMTFG